jgi:hypothetical protein
MADIGKPGAPGSVTAPRGEWVVLSFQLTGDATPALLTNYDGVVDETLGLTDTGAGQITLSLRERWAHIQVLSVNVQTTAGSHLGSAKVTTSTNPQTVLVLTYDTDATAALADTSATIDVTLLARRNTNTG